MSLIRTINSLINGRQASPVSITGAWSFQVPVKLKGYTVAGLPSGTQGDVAFVTDATAPTFLGTLTGGGAVITPVFHNGTAWVSV